MFYVEELKEIDNKKEVNDSKEYKIQLENETWVPCRDYQIDSIKTYIFHKDKIFTKNENNIYNQKIKTEIGAWVDFEGVTMNYGYLDYVFKLRPKFIRGKIQEGFFIMIRENKTEALLKVENSK